MDSHVKISLLEVLFIHTFQDDNAIECLLCYDILFSFNKNSILRHATSLDLNTPFFAPAAGRFQFGVDCE
jgi:hypothetical protein